MKNSGWPQLTYEEALQKRIEADERRRNKPKSQAAKAGSTRTRRRDLEHSALEMDWKDEIRQKDASTCQFPAYNGEPKCIVKDIHIHCHHINPRSQRKDLLYVKSNGTCLCPKHHTWVHDNPTEAIELGLLRNRSRELAAKEGTLGQY